MVDFDKREATIYGTSLFFVPYFLVYYNQDCPAYQECTIFTRYNVSHIRGTESANCSQPFLIASKLKLNDGCFLGAGGYAAGHVR